MLEYQLILTERVIAVKRMQKWGPTILRVVLGIIFIDHGWDKVQGLYGYLQGAEWGFVNFVGSIPFLVILPNVLWATLATAAEFLGGILVVLGYRTRLASFGLSMVMLVALLGVHLPKAMGPKVGFMGEIELPLALMAMAVSLLFTGPGRYSIELKK